MVEVRQCRRREEGREGGREGGEGREGTLIKSRDPHLAGGEKDRYHQKYWFITDTPEGKQTVCY